MTAAPPDFAEIDPQRRVSDGPAGYVFAWLARNTAEERDRWILWVPALIGTGIAIYFALGSEPPLWSGVAGLVGTVLARLALSRWSVAAMGATCLALVFLGVTAAQMRVSTMSAPVLSREIGRAEIEGRACELSLLPNGYRVYLDHPTIAGLVPEETPRRIRLRVLGPSAADHAGQWVRMSARVGPITEPVAPGAFDFQRNVFFAGIGAVGFSFGGPQPVAAREEIGWIGSLPCRLSVLRLEVAKRVRSALASDTGAVAAALITGDRGAISQPVQQNMRDSGLAHLLAISGLHVGLVAGILFVAVRRLLCLVPSIALYHPIKKWGALAAIVGTLFYVLLAGAPVPTVRAYIMASMFLLAVILDRTAISMPPVAWAATAILLASPEELIGPSFQMSFGAVVGLVAAYEATRRLRLRMRAERGRGGRVGLYVGGVIFTSLIATLATGPYAIYHFNRIAMYGIAANIVAVPVTGLWIMPWAVLAVMLMPFGLEHVALTPMGWGIDAVLWVAAQTSSLPAAAVVVPVLPNAGLALITIGGLWLCLWQRRWRLTGVPAILLGLATIAVARPPDVLVAGDGHLFAVADPAGPLLLSTSTVDRFIADAWLRRSGTDLLGELPQDGYGAEGRLACDSLGCVYTAYGRTVAVVREPLALAEDCRIADVVVSLEPVRVPCPAAMAVIDRFDLWRNGAHAIWVGRDGSIDIRSVQELRGDRPWVVRPQRRE
jgi:competence protein ComEC